MPPAGRHQVVQRRRSACSLHDSAVPVPTTSICPPRQRAEPPRAADLANAAVGKRVGSVDRAARARTAARGTCNRREDHRQALLIARLYPAYEIGSGNLSMSPPVTVNPSQATACTRTKGNSGKAQGRAPPRA